MPRNPMDALHELDRFTDLVAILLRHGLGDLIHRIGLDKALRKLRRPADRQLDEVSAGLEPPQRLRRALEEMGPTFVKLGQLLSTRVDLLPKAYIDELSLLHSKVPAVPLEELLVEVEKFLGHPLADDFVTIDPVALGGGSIAQVHRATLKTGEQVIIKIRRPGVGALIEADLRLLRHFVDLAADESPLIAKARPREVVEEFARSIRAELDLVNEGHNAERIAANFRENPYIHVPGIHWKWTNERMNVQDVAVGLPGTDLDAVRDAGLDLKLIAARGAQAVLQMMFEDRFFHADPHPGNVFYRPGNEITFIDFGMVGRISRERREQLVDLLSGIVDRRPEKVTRILLDWADAGFAQERALASRIDGFIDRVHGVPLARLNITVLIYDLVALIREFDLALPPDLAMLIKAFTTLDGMGRELDPEFDIIAAAQPFLQRFLLARFSPRQLARDMREGMVEGVGLLNRLPGDLNRLIAATQRGELHFGIDFRQMDRLQKEIERSVTRLTLGMLIAAVIMGSSIVMTVAGGDLPVGVTFFAMLGFFMAVAGALWLLWSILRGGSQP